MKPLLLLANVLLAQLSFSATTFIGGHFDHPSAKTVTIQYYASILGHIEQRTLKQELELDSKNNFMFVTEAEYPLQFNLYNGDKRLFINKYAAAGDSLWFEFKTDKIAINGNCEECVAFMFEWEDKFLSAPEVSQEFNSSFNRLEPKEFAAYWNKRRTDQLAYLENYFKGKTMPATFRHYIEAEINYDYGVSMLQYSWKHKSVKGVLQDTSYIKFLDHIRIDNPDALVSGTYLHFIMELPNCMWMNRGDAFDKNDSTGKIYRMNQNAIRASLSKKYFSGRVYELAMYQLFLGEIKWCENFKERKNFEQFYHQRDSMLTSYSAAFTDHMYYERLVNKLHDVISPSKLASDFVLKDLNGKNVRLSDFRGKVVYLDFWATNCPPCVAEIPYAHDLKEKFENKDIVFLYISLDRYRDNLSNFIASHSFEGTHLNDPMGFASDVCDTYEINSIPHYFLIDKNGYLVNGNAPRPSAHPEDAIMKLLQ